MVDPKVDCIIFDVDGKAADIDGIVWRFVSSAQDAPLCGLY